MESLPIDVINHIIFFLPIKEIHQFIKTSRNFKKEIHITWKRFMMRDFKIKPKNNNPMICYQLLYFVQKKENCYFSDFLLQSQLNLDWQDQFGKTALMRASF